MLYDAVRGALSRRTARVLDTARAPAVPLGSRMAVVSNVTVVRLGERRMLAGTQTAMRDAVVLWDLTGKEIQKLPCGGVSTDMSLRTVDDGDVLWLGVGQWHRGTGSQSISVHRFAQEGADRSMTPPLLKRDGFVFDLGRWQGRASIACYSPGERSLSVESLADSWDAEQWELPSGTDILDLVLVGARDVLVAVTSDERLLFYAPGSAHPVANVHVGADIWSVAPVDEQIIGVGTANALFALQLPPA